MNKKIFYLIQILLFVVTVIFVFIGRIWQGANYFVVALLFVIVFNFSVQNVFNFKNYLNELKEQSNIYFAQEYNKGNITKYQFDTKDKEVYERYNKLNKFTKIKKIIIMVCMFAISISILCLMFFIR